MLNVELPEPFTNVGEKFAAVPAGNPLTLKSTSSLKLFMALIVVVKFVPFPATTVAVSGDAVIPKSVTVRPTAVLFVMPALTP